MKKLLCFPLSVLAFYAHAQLATLETNNPAPRVGDEIELIITLKKENLGALEQKEHKTMADNQALRSNKIAVGTLKVSQMLTDTGMVKIGPFHFTLANQQFDTDVLTLHVAPRLADNVKDGLWIRNVTFHGQSYLIVEQRIANTPARNKAATDEDVVNAEAEAAFAQLDPDKFEKAGLEIISTSSRSESQLLSDGNAQKTSMVDYRVATYKFRKKPGFAKKVKIDKSFFVDYPSRGTIVEAVIM